MKKITILFAALAAMVSCNKENPVSPETPSQEKYSFSITASAPESEDMTKTTLVEGGNYVHWSKGDAIKVLFFGHYGGASHSYDSRIWTSSGQVFTSYFEEEAAQEANFRIDNWSWAKGDTWYKDSGIAVYPSTSTAVSTKKVDSVTDYTFDNEVSFELPVNQEAIEGNIQSGLNFSYARVDHQTFRNTIAGEGSTSLQFKNACALIKLTMPQSFGDKKVTEVSVVSSDYKPLTGYARVKTNTSNSKVSQDVIYSPFTMQVSGDSGVTLTCADGFKAGASYYAVVWPGEHAGLIITFKADDETTAVVETKAVNLQASHIKPYKFNSELSFAGKVVDKYPEDCVEGETYNYYYSDGTVGDNPRPEGKSVLGVIFYWGNARGLDTQLPAHCTHGMAISVNQHKIAWGKFSGGYLPNSDYTTYGLDQHSANWGYDSMLKLKDLYAASAVDFTVYTYSYGDIDLNRTSGWYIPSGKEWDMINDNTSLSALLSDCGAAGFITANSPWSTDGYWLPSLGGTRVANVLLFYSGVTYTTLTIGSDSSYARPIFAF